MDGNKKHQGVKREMPILKCVNSWGGLNIYIRKQERICITF